MPVVHPPNETQAEARQLQLVRADKLQRGDPVITLDDLSFTYPDGYPALRGVSLSVAAGERVAGVDGHWSLRVESESSASSAPRM